MNLLNLLIVKTLPLVPKPIVRKFASRYIAGENHSDAIEVTRRLNDKGILATLDVLGEDISERGDAINAKVECLKTLESIDKNKLNANLSLKLTQLGLKIDYGFCFFNLTEILTVARSLDIFVRIDMEDSTCTDETLSIFDTVRKDFPKCGIVLQSYLKRSLSDAEKYSREKTNFRLCKGIYIEHEKIAYKKKNEINESYIKIMREILVNKCYLGIATHDEYLIASAYKLIEELQLKKDEYEFQMLLGVKENLRDKILQDGHRIRVYIPFGIHWYKYSIRRFKENPEIANYVLKSILRLD